MEILKYIVLSGVLFFTFLTNNAQNVIQKNWCWTDQYRQEQYNQDPSLIQQNEIIEQYILNNKKAIVSSINNKKTITYIIPVVWHVVTYNGVGNVSKKDIEDQMIRLNEDFQRLNADKVNTRALFAPYAADIQVEFRLAHKDPNGNCTEGIVRVESPLTIKAPNSVKSVSYWDSKKYFNIWTVASMSGDNPPSIIFGYAQFPSSGINSTYGVVMRYNYIGRNERTLSHEVGHCFGLYHTFQSGCGSNCSNSGDLCCDTPPVSASTQGCDVNQNTCSNDANGPDPYNANVVDQIENYMSYDACQNMFSEDQKIRMYAYLNSTNIGTGLNQLTTSSNLSFTGTNDPYTGVSCLPVADFSYNKNYICEGDSISYMDQSYNGNVISWNWSFTGGSPLGSSVSNPTITYNVPGVYSVTNQPSTAAGPGTITKTNLVTVSSLTADYVGPIIDGFENVTQFNNDWRIENYDNGSQTWENNSVAAVTGSNSVRIRNSITPYGQLDELISPSFDVSSTPNKIMKFKLAYARKTAADSAERLFVYTSINCGASWSLKLPLTPNVMASAPPQSSTFVPNSSQWLEKTIDLTSIGSATNVRFKFALTSGGGNDIYIDDINIGGIVGIEELFNNIGSFDIYPNPTNSIVNIEELQEVEYINIYTLQGKLVQSISWNKTRKQQIKLPEEKGVYLIKIKTKNQLSITKKIINY